MGKVVCCTCGPLDDDVVDAIDWSVKLDRAIVGYRLDYEECVYLSSLLKRLIKKINEKGD